MADDPYARIKELEAENSALRRRVGIATDRAVLAEAEREEAREQQTATSEILRIFAWSPVDAHPILGAVVESAWRLSGSSFAALGIREGDVLVAAAAAARRGCTPRRAATTGWSPVRDPGPGHAGVRRHDR